MNTTKRTATFGVGAIIAAAALIGGLNLVRADSGATKVGSLSAVSAANIADWQASGRMPVLPDGPVAEVSTGTQFAVAEVNGLTAVTAELNGVPQKVQRVDGAFMVTIGAIDGVGAAELTLVESFDDGSALSVPFTVYAHAAHDGAMAPVTAANSSAPVSTEVTLTWDQVGVAQGGDADFSGPLAIVALGGGATAVLDNVNSRVIAVSRDGVVSTLAELPTDTFTSLVRSADGHHMVAIDTIGGTAYDLQSGTSQPLPALMSAMPMGLDMSLDADGTLFVTSPADGVQYSVGLANSSAMPEQTTRRLDLPRAWVDGSMLYVQPDMSAQPLAVQVEPTGALSILGLDRLSDGRVAVLLEIAGKSTVDTRLIVVGASHVEAVALEGQSVFLVDHPMSVLGTSVTYASYDQRGLVLTTVTL